MVELYVNAHTLTDFTNMPLNHILKAPDVNE